MQRLERLVVHAEEAVRLGLMPDESHLRLGLLLLDSAAELMMHRQCEWLLAQAEMYEGWLRGATAFKAATGRGAERVAELQKEALSAGQRKNIERDFNAKCDYLRQHDLLPDAQARVLKKLHKYRNETYHRDRLRPATLANAARIYIYVVCTMLRDLPSYVTSYTELDPRPGLVKYLSDEERGAAGLFGVEDRLPARIATCLLKESGVAEPARLGAALADHVCDRLDDLVEAAGECAEFMAQTSLDERWDLEAILGIVQISPERYLDVRNSDDARALDVPVRSAQLDQWRGAAQALATQADDLAAFAAFANIEDAFEPVEAKVLKLAADVDREIQLQLDMALGK
jgi:hypothetical protein